MLQKKKQLTGSRSLCRHRRYSHPFIPTSIPPLTSKSGIEMWPFRSTPPTKPWGLRWRCSMWYATFGECPRLPFFLPSYPNILTVENSHSCLLRCVLTLANLILQAKLIVSAGRIDVRHRSLLRCYSHYALSVETDGVP